ncbi:MAG TPA: HD domain-containing protein [Bdellovibrionota bacterium]
MRNETLSQRMELKHWIESRPRLNPLLAAAQGQGGEDAAHDSAHLLRVALWTCRLMQASGFEERAVAAALLHDLVNLPKNHPDRALASERSAEAAKGILEGAGFSVGEIREITLAIRQHSFSRGEAPSSALGKALQDADRLEALGAIGLMRVFSTGAKMGASYFHPEDPWALSRPLDDKSYSVDHFFTKLLKLADTMNTEAGREEAKLRLRPLRVFLESLGHELGEELP